MINSLNTHSDADLDELQDFMSFESEMQTDNRNGPGAALHLPLQRNWRRKGMSLAQLPIPEVRGEHPLPALSYAQQRWFLWQWEPASATYNIRLP